VLDYYRHDDVVVCLITVDLMLLLYVFHQITQIFSGLMKVGVNDLLTDDIGTCAHNIKCFKAGKSLLGDLIMLFVLDYCRLDVVVVCLIAVDLMML
jgi:hypothetical protein